MCRGLGGEGYECPNGGLGSDLVNLGVGARRVYVGLQSDLDGNGFCVGVVDVERYLHVVGGVVDGFGEEEEVALRGGYLEGFALGAVAHRGDGCGAGEGAEERRPAVGRQCEVVEGIDERKLLETAGGGEGYGVRPTGVPQVRVGAVHAQTEGVCGVWIQGGKGAGGFGGDIESLGGEQDAVAIKFVFGKSGDGAYGAVVPNDADRSVGDAGNGEVDGVGAACGRGDADVVEV